MHKNNHFVRQTHYSPFNSICQPKLKNYVTKGVNKLRIRQNNCRIQTISKRTSYNKNIIQSKRQTKRKTSAIQHPLNRPSATKKVSASSRFPTRCAVRWEPSINPNKERNRVASRPDFDVTKRGSKCQAALPPAAANVSGHRPPYNRGILAEAHFWRVSSSQRLH